MVIISSMTTTITHTHTSRKYHIHTSLVDLCHMLEIITLKNHDGHVAGPQTSLDPKFYGKLTLMVLQTCFTTKPLYIYAKKPALLPLAPQYLCLINRDRYFIVIHYLNFHQSPWRRNIHDDVIKWKHFPRYWPFVRESHRSPMNSPH